jgi:hypothetical protein
VTASGFGHDEDMARGVETEVIVRLNALDTVNGKLSVREIVKLYVPGDEDESVPEITPVDAFKVRFGGKLPEATDQVV